MKAMKTTGALVMLILLVSCGTMKEKGFKESGNSEKAEKTENHRSAMAPEKNQVKPEFNIQELEDGSETYMFYGYDFNLETRTLGSKKKAYYVESPEVVNFYSQRVIEGVLYSVYKLENGVVAVPQ